MAMTTDAIVGSGPNGLVAASTLADAGWDVAADRPDRGTDGRVGPIHVAITPPVSPFANPAGS